MLKHRFLRPKKLYNLPELGGGGEVIRAMPERKRFFPVRCSLLNSKTHQDLRLLHHFYPLSIKLALGSCWNTNPFWPHGIKSGMGGVENSKVVFSFVNIVM